MPSIFIILFHLARVPSFCGQVILHIFFIYLDCFHVLAVVNNAVMKVGLHILFKVAFLFPSSNYPELELLNHMVILFLIEENFEESPHCVP